MKHRILSLLVYALPLVLSAQFASELRVIDEGAIPFTKFLSKADFDQRYPGEIVTDPSTLDTGWYVIYEHESLSYYFGPILLESTGQDYLEQLQGTVEGAVAQRPSIQGYRLELSFEPQESATSNDSSPEGDPSNQPSAPQPVAQPSIFEVIKRWFGF